MPGAVDSMTQFMQGLLQNIKRGGPSQEEIARRKGMEYNGQYPTEHHLETQQALIEAAQNGFTPKGFQGTPEQYKQALAQAYLQTYAQQGQEFGTPEALAKNQAADPAQGHTGNALEWARQQVHPPITR